MLRRAVIISALTVVPGIASAEPLCTTDARQVVDEIYRHVLERAPDRDSQGWVDQLAGENTTVREVVRAIAKSPEHIQRFGTESRDSVINTLYRHLLNRQPDPQGHRTSLQIAERNGLGAVIDSFVNSREYEEQFGDWRVPGSSGVNYCAPGAQGPQNQSSRNNSMRFRRMDTNNDGRIARSEWRGNARSFQNFDWNNDGVLSGDEVSVNGVRRGDEGEDRDVDMGNDDRFDYLDVNGNNLIDRNEWDGGYQAFTRLDTSGDRRLTRAEYNGMNRGSSFDNLDTDNDNRLVLAEWPWTHRSFDQQDTNGDGVILRNEFRGAPGTRR
jgi:Ca2+-binding EF-hand superfamily protein